LGEITGNIYEGIFLMKESGLNDAYGDFRIFGESFEVENMSNSGLESPTHNDSPRSDRQSGVATAYIQKISLIGLT
jgi:hypothetical protein